MNIPLSVSVARTSSALLVAAVLFQAGRVVGRLEGEASGPAVAGRGDPGTELVHSSFAGPHPMPATVETPQPANAGNPPGAEDIITPLNVRDPSALVMGPGGGYSCPSPALPPPPEPAPRLSEKPLEEGRLLDLLKKRGEERDRDAPRVY